MSDPFRKAENLSIIKNFKEIIKTLEKPDDTCLLCHNIIDIPVFFWKSRESKCKCRLFICNECCINYINTFNSLEKVVCIICKEPVGLKIRDNFEVECKFTLHSIRFYYMSILDLKYPEGIKCRHCDWVGSRSEHEYKHILECEGVMVYCTNEQCDSKFKFSELQDHLDTKCNYRVMTCDNCKESMTNEKFKNHNPCIVTRKYNITHTFESSSKEVDTLSFLKRMEEIVYEATGCKYNLTLKEK